MKTSRKKAEKPTKNPLWWKRHSTMFGKTSHVATLGEQRLPWMVILKRKN